MNRLKISSNPFIVASSPESHFRFRCNGSSDTVLNREFQSRHSRVEANSFESLPKIDRSRDDRPLTIGMSCFLQGCPALSDVLKQLEYPYSIVPVSSEFEIIRRIEEHKLDYGILPRASSKPDMVSKRIASVPVFIAVDSTHPLAGLDECMLEDFDLPIFGLPCAQRFPALHFALRDFLGEKIADALVAVTHEVPEDLLANTFAGACCPMLVNDLPKERGSCTILRIVQSKGVPLHLWRLPGK